MALKRALGASTLLAAAVMLVISSGCVNLGGVSTTATFDNGVVIQNFEPELSSVYSGEDVRLQMKIKNLGSFDASGDATIDLSEWGCGSSGAAQKTFSLLPPNAERGTEGGEAVILWTCTAPDIAEGLTVPYEARAQVEYPYQSVSSKTITLLPTSDLIALNNAGKPLPSEDETQSHSPVRVDVVVKGPIRISENNGQVIFPVTLKITNVGGGIVQDGLIDLEVEKTTGAITNMKDCDQQNLPLWRGQSQTVTCEMTANKVTSMTQARIVATATYTYVISSSARIVATGTKDSTLGGGGGCPPGGCQSGWV